MPRKLNLALQKRNILKTFKKFNPDADPQRLDWDCLDSTLQSSENFDNMVEGNPQFVWKDELAELLETEHERQMDIMYEAEIDDRKVMEQILEIYGDVSSFTTLKLQTIAKQQESHIGEVFSRVVEVKPTKRGKYKGAVVQVVVTNKKWVDYLIGKKAKIVIYNVDSKQ